MSTREDRLSDFLARATQISDSWNMPTPVFKLRTRWAADYDSLFAERGTVITDERQIIDLVLEKGRAILSSRAGEGKTCMLRRLYRQALQRGIAPILLDLRKWTSDDYLIWKKWTSRSAIDGADFLVSSFSDVGLGILELDQLPPTVDKLILLDGLNEIITPVGTQILEIVDSLVSNQMRTSVLVADRSVRRDLPSPDRWTIGTILPLEREELLTYTSDLEDVNVAVLRSPFFLNTSLQSTAQGNAPGASRSVSLAHRLQFTQDELAVAGEAAYRAYLLSKSRIFNIESFRKAVGEGVVQRLQSSSDLIVNDDGNAYFSHHIIHDYLCSRHLATLPTEQWTSAVFSAVSFDSASFDAIAMAFEQLSGNRADSFLRALYDWNLYAAGYALGQIGANDGSASIELRTMIYAMLAEKRFDPVVATRQRATDALLLMKFDDAQPFLAAPSFESVQDVLAVVEGQGTWFGEWKSLFLTRRADHIGIDRLQALKDADSVVGWTMANVAKRAFVDMEDVALIGKWMDSTSDTVRWRVIHVLGAYPSDTNVAILSSALDNDGDQNVRYGAVRSLVELAARAGVEMRDQIAGILVERVKKITEQARILKELQNALVLDKSFVPADWLSFATRVIRVFYVETDSIDERDVWRAILTAVELECSPSGVQAR